MTYNTSQINLFSKCLVANCTTCKWKKQLLQKLMKGRFYKNGGEKKRDFLFFPSKIHSFSRNHGAEKDSWSMNRKSAPHSELTAHCHSPTAFCRPLSHSHKCPINLSQWQHSSNSSMKIWKVLPGCSKKQTITPIHFSGWRRLLAHHIYCLTVLELNKK